LAFFHSHKSVFLYVEFICQISEADKMFLQLNSRDAMIYVYKKSIFEVNNELVEVCSQASKMKFDRITTQIATAKLLMSFIITSDKSKDNIVRFRNITNRLHKLDNETTESFERIVHAISLNSDDIHYLFTFVELLLDKGRDAIIGSHNKHISNEKMCNLSPTDLVTLLCG
jgi:hypothetical protein